jgi:hypothetical protein
MARTFIEKSRFFVLYFFRCRRREKQHQSSERKKKKNKKKRMERLLKFHQKLVDQSGLPPSRLMEQQPPKLCSTGGIKRRNLFDEFHLPGEKEQQVESEPRVPEPGIPAAVLPLLPLLELFREGASGMNKLW